MGDGLSKPLAEHTAEQVAELLTQLGSGSGKYSAYADQVRDNAVDGALLTELSQEEWEETLHDLQVTNRLHVRVLTKEWKAAVQQSSSLIVAPPPPTTPTSTTTTSSPIQQEPSSSSLMRDLSMRSGMTNTTCSIRSAAPRCMAHMRQVMEPSPSLSPVPVVSDHKLLPILQAVQEYDIDEDTSHDELEEFQKLVETASASMGSAALYTGLHLLDADGHLVVSATNKLQTNNNGTTANKDRLHVPKEASQCYRSLLENDKDVIIKRHYELGTVKNKNTRQSSQSEPSSCDVDEESKQQPHDETSSHHDDTSPDLTYVGMVTKSRTGERVGLLCVVLNENETEFDAQKQNILQEFATLAQDQLEERRVLVERNRKLRQQIQAMEMGDTVNGRTNSNGSGDDDNDDTSSVTMDSAIILPRNGPVRGVLRSEVAQRPKSFFPTLQEWKHSGKTINSSSLPFDKDKIASKAEMGHLPEDIFDINKQLGAGIPPIHKNDMERVAFIKNIGLKHMQPDDPTALALKRIAVLAAELFDVDHVSFSMMEHDMDYNLVNYSPRPDNPMAKHRKTIKQDTDGGTWLSCNPRGFAFCNYTLFAGETFTAQDPSMDAALSWVPFRFYSSSPIRYGGHIVATLCLFDWKRAHPEFGAAHQIQQEQLAEMASQHIANWVLRQEMEKLERDRERAMQRLSVPNSPQHSLTMSPKRNRMPAPENTCAIIFTDVQGSTSLWEANPNLMQEALRLHDKIMREQIAAHNGYEIMTEGDAFHMAFHDSVDAVAFALAVQTNLHRADWNEALFDLPDASIDTKKKFRGLRVRMAIHFGDVEYRRNSVTQQREYIGATVNIAKSLEHMSHGGQILVTSDVWSEASYLAVSELGSPQVLDLGSHVLLSGKKQGEGVVCKGVIQLVPAELACDYAQPSEVRVGRQFPPVLTTKQMGASFHDAPCAGHCATLVFVYASQVEAEFSNASMVLAALAKEIGGMLIGRSGYQCKDLMLSFPNESDAVTFGLDLQDYFRRNLILGANLDGMIKVGLHHGSFTTMIPSPQTGRADYFGKVVNRAARVAGVARVGEVWLGVQSDQDLPPDLGPGLTVTFNGIRSLKGVQEDMALYKCTR